MKKITFPLLLLIYTFSFAQDVHTVPNNWLGLFFHTPEFLGGPYDNLEVAKGTYSYMDSEKVKILEKQYLTSEYLDAKVDDFTTKAKLRYNLYNDQMEFIKDDSIYYLKKEEGRTVRFVDSNDIYKVYKVYGNLEFLKVDVSGDYSLLVKQSKSFVTPKQRRINYGYHIDATFKRNRDVFFIKLPNSKVLEIPTKKSEFLDLFKNRTKEIESYIKKNKVNLKKEEDLKELIIHLNSLPSNVIRA